MNRDYARLAAVAVFVVAAIVFVRRRWQERVEDVGLLITETVGAASVELAASSASKERAMALSVASLSPDERRRVLDVMTYAAARLEARASPLGTDFGDQDPMAELEDAVAPYLPVLTAGRVFERGDWSLVGLTVRAVPSCEGLALAPKQRCVRLWPEGGAGKPDPLFERARWAAWPIAHARAVTFESVDVRDRVAAKLRERITVAGAVIALVLTAEDLALRPVSERAALEQAARRLGAAMAANELDASTQLDALAHEVPAGRVAPWIALAPAELLVVPRLSALSRAAELRAEIERASEGRWHRARGER